MRCRYRVALHWIWPNLGWPIRDYLFITKRNFIVAFVPSPSACETVGVIIVGHVADLAESVWMPQNSGDLPGRHSGPKL